ncbi:MAG: hypothetical protein K2X86_15095 [Cytophagaceae bacterium]|nr:hypothetical protein [Cytophagaceae bacterium]
MRFTFLLILTLTIVSCRDKEQTSSTTDSARQSPNTEPIIEKKPKRPQAGLILSSDNIKIFGDTTIEKEKIYLTSIKFEPYISFDDFKVDKIEKIKAELNLSSNKDAYRFRSRIREAYNADTVNFAGHYTFAWWGCGSPCQSGVIIDRRTGQVYDAPSAALGYDFRPNSRMLIVNTPDSLGFYDDCFYCKPIIYVLDEATKEFIERLPK